MYAICEVALVNLFSLRAPTTNAFTARTLPCPSPAALKLALLAKLIERDAPGRSPDEIASLGQRHLNWLAPLRVGWASPPWLAISAATMTVLKEDNGKTPLIRSVGVREYAHFDQPFGLALGPMTDDRADGEADGARRADLAEALSRLRALGVAESLIQPKGPPQWLAEAPTGEEWVWLTDDAETASRPGEARREREAYLLDDLGRAPSFARLSLYRSVEAAYTPRLGEDRRRIIVTLPLRQRRQNLAGRTFERVL